MVFDEVDTGISGKTASVVGEKLQKIADSHQVICVTHLPQIAVMADHHLYIEKQTQASDTVSSVRSLNHDERIEEIGRLIGGDTITETTRVHALELLELAKKKKTVILKVGKTMSEKIRVLIVDDNQNFCTILSEHISEQDDLEVVGIANNGLKAVDLIKETMPDIVVLDIIMPHLDGLGVS